MESLFQPWGFKTRSLYKTHYIKVPVPGYSSPNKKIRQLAIENVMKVENWDQIISEEINNVNPNVILSMGELALSGLTEEKGFH